MTVFVVIPGDLDTRTGGYGYDRRIIGGLRERGWTVEVVRLDDAFPEPDAKVRARATAALTAIPDQALVLVDGLAFGALPAEVEREADRLRFVALVHHPLAAETGIDPALASALAVSERRALAFARAVVVTSATTRDSLVAGYAVPADRITVVEPGTDVGPRRSSGFRVRLSAAGEQPSPLTPQPCDVSLLCVATITPRKGHELLVNALASIPHRRWHLVCAGSLDRDPPTVARLRAQLRAHGVEERVELTGDLDTDALDARYAAADLFVLPTLYEGYGMAVAEALARGLPVISTATGAIDDLVTGGSNQPAGLVVPPGDAGAFAAALGRVLGDANLLARFAEGAALAHARLPSWATACAKMAGVLEGVATGG